LTPKPNQFIDVPKCINDKSLAKIHQDTGDIVETFSLQTDGWMEEWTEAFKTYSLQRLKKQIQPMYLRISEVDMDQE